MLHSERNQLHATQTSLFLQVYSMQLILSNLVLFKTNQKLAYTVVSQSKRRSKVDRFAVFNCIPQPPAVANFRPFPLCLFLFSYPICVCCPKVHFLTSWFQQSHCGWPNIVSIASLCPTGSILPTSIDEDQAAQVYHRQRIACSIDYKETQSTFRLREPSVHAGSVQVTNALEKHYISLFHNPGQKTLRPLQSPAFSQASRIINPRYRAQLLAGKHYAFPVTKS